MSQIDRSRQQQIARKEAIKKNELQDEKEFANFWKDRMAELSDMEKEEQQAQRDRAKQL